MRLLKRLEQLEEEPPHLIFFCSSMYEGFLDTSGAERYWMSAGSCRLRRAFTSWTFWTCRTV